MICLADDVIFIAQEDDIAVGIDDVGEVFDVAEGASGIGVDEIFGLSFADIGIELHKVNIQTNRLRRFLKGL